MPKKDVVRVRLPREAANLLESKAEEEGKTPSEVLIELIEHMTKHSNRPSA